MRAYFIAGLPAAGKDTIADIIAKYTGKRKVSVSADIITPILEDPEFRKYIEQHTKKDLSNITREHHPAGREGLIIAGQELISIFKDMYPHFSGLAFYLYGENIIIPSFRQTTMLEHPRKLRIPVTTINIITKTTLRHDRWSARDNIQEELMNQQDEEEKRHFYTPLLQSHIFDEEFYNDGTIKELEQRVREIIEHGEV